jgi:hypothetical protein
LLYWGYILIFTFSIILLDPPPSLLEQFQQVKFVHFHTCGYTISTTFTSYTLSISPTGTNPPRQTCVLPSCPPFWKKDFCLFKISTQEVLLCYFHVYMYFIPNWLPLRLCDLFFIFILHCLGVCSLYKF